MMGKPSSPPPLPLGTMLLHILVKACTHLDDAVGCGGNTGPQVSTLLCHRAGDGRACTGGKAAATGSSTSQSDVSDAIQSVSSSVPAMSDCVLECDRAKSPCQSLKAHCHSVHLSVCLSVCPWTWPPSLVEGCKSCRASHVASYTVRHRHRLETHEILLADSRRVAVIP